MLNTGVTRNQKDNSSNHTYNNSLFNNNFNMYTFSNMQNNTATSFKKENNAETESTNNDVVSCSFTLSLQEMITIVIILII